VRKQKGTKERAEKLIDLLRGPTDGDVEQLMELAKDAKAEGDTEMAEHASFFALSFLLEDCGNPRPWGED
jgi:hypothetical protein